MRGFVWGNGTGVRLIQIAAGASTVYDSEHNKCGGRSLAAEIRLAFAAGTYSITAEISSSLPGSSTLGLVITGPATNYPNTLSARPTAALVSAYTVEGYQVFAIAGGCNNPITIQYLEINGNHPATGGGGIYVNGGNSSGLTIQYNYIHGNYEQTPQVQGTSPKQTVSYTDDFNANLIELTGGFGVTNTGTTIQYNIFGNPVAGDCGGMMTWVGDVANSGTSNQQFVGYDSQGGSCNAFGSLVSTANLLFQYNVIQQQEQGMKFYEGGSGPPNLYYQTNDVVQYNDFGFIHRIYLETQQSPVTSSQPFQLNYNDFHDPVDTSFGSWVLSGAQNYYTNMIGNVVSYNGSGVATNSPGSAEFWGDGTYQYNLVQGTAACGAQYESAGNMVMANNTMQGTFGTSTNYVCAEAGAPAPSGLSTNSYSTSLSAVTSAPPSIAPAAGSYASPQTITLTDNGYTSGNQPLGNTSIWYTTDGTTPVPGQGSAQFYTGPFSATLPVTIKAVGMWGAHTQPTAYATGYGFVPSAVVTAIYSSSGGGGGGPVTWNVKTSWGATGTGTTNDGPAIQAGAAKISAGDSVYFPAGTYLINNVVTFSAAANITCQAGAVIEGPNLGTDVLSIVSNTTVGGSATTGCTFSGGGIRASGSGGDNSQTLSQAISNLTITYNTFENMTYATNNYRTNGGIMLGGGSNNVVIRYNLFSNITPYTDGYNASGTTYLTQYDPDGSTPRSAIWFYGASNLSIDHNTFTNDYQNITGCQAQSFQAQNLAIHHNYSYAHHRMFMQINTGSGCGNAQYNAGIAGFAVYCELRPVCRRGPVPLQRELWFLGSVCHRERHGDPDERGELVRQCDQGPGAGHVSTGVGIGIEAGAQNMNVYNNAVMGQWAQAGAGYGGTSGGYMQNNYGMPRPARGGRGAHVCR